MSENNISHSSESEDETFPLAQKCARCGRYLLQSQKVVPDPKHKNWYSHAKCVKLWQRNKSVQIKDHNVQPE